VLLLAAVVLQVQVALQVLALQVLALPLVAAAVATT